MADEFGGIPVDEPQTDEFGGIAVSEPSLPQIKLSPYEQYRMSGREPVAGPFGPASPEEVPAMLESAQRPFIPLPDTVAKGPLPALYRSVIKPVVEGIESPAGLLMMPALAESAPLRIAAGLGFGGMAAKSGLEKMQSADPQTQLEGRMEFAASPLFALTGGKREKGATPTERIVPEATPEPPEALPKAPEIPPEKAPPTEAPEGEPPTAPATVEASGEPVAAGPPEPAKVEPSATPTVTQEHPPIVGMGGAVPGEFIGSTGADIYGVAQRVREERAAAGQTPAILPGQGVSDVEAVTHGKLLLARDPTLAEKALDAFTKTKAISYDAMSTVRAKGEEASLAARRVEEKFGTDSPEYQNAFENLARWDKVSKEMQTEWHKTGMSQQGQTDIDTGTFTGLQRAFTEATGKTFDEAQSRTAKDLAGKSQKSTADVVAAKDKLFKTLDVAPADPKVQSLADRIVSVLDKGANDALSRIKARRAEGRLFAAGIDPEALGDYAIYGAAKIAKGAIEFSKWSAEMVKDIGDYIQPHLKQIWDAANKHLDQEISKHGPAAEQIKRTFRGKPSTAEGVRAVISTREPGAKFTLDQVKAIWNYAKEHYLSKGVNDFTDVVHGIATDLGMKPDEVREALAQPKGAKKMTDEMYAKMSEQRKIQNQAKMWVKDQQVPGWLRFMRSVPRVFFIDKVFGHGTVGMITHAGLNIFDPTAWKTYWPAFIKQYGLVFKPAYHERMMQELAKDPLFIKARRAGLANDPWRYSDDYQNAAIKTFMGKFGGLVGNRGFDALKIFRQARFNQIWNSYPDLLKTDDMAKMLADSINPATGVTSRAFPEWTGWTFFAPKLEGSRWVWMIGNPARAAAIFKEWKTATPEQKAFAMAELKQKATIAGTYFSLLAMNQGLLKASGSDENINFTNPRKGDFLAFKVSGHNVGLVGPMLGMVRLFANLVHDAAGKRGKLEQLTPRGAAIAEDLGSYARGKLSPFAGQAYNLASQSDFQGRPLPYSSDPVPSYLRKRGVKKYTYGEYAAQELLPIPFEEAFKEVMANQGMNESEIKKYLSALTIAVAAGGTGMRVSKDYNLKGQ